MSNLDIAVEIVEVLQEWINETWQGVDDEAMPILSVHWSLGYLAIEWGNCTLWSSDENDGRELCLDYIKSRFLNGIQSLYSSFGNCKIPEFDPPSDFSPENN